MTLITKEIETAIIECQTFIVGTDKIKQIIGDFNSDSGLSKKELFLLGVELGKLYEYEQEHSTYGNGFDAKVFSLIKEIETELIK